MKIGILTFHWATNYGAILQAYALQTYLKNRGHEVHIINYRPKHYKKTLIRCILTPRFWVWLKNLREYFKEIKLRPFRNQYFSESILFESLSGLRRNSPNFDVYICGSDQIWNPSFTSLGEGKPTTTYFLDFGEKRIKRIAYAVSFGCESYPEPAFSIAKQQIKQFSAISVRENSGVDIVNKLGCDRVVKLPDPTFLIAPYNYPFRGLRKKEIKNRNVFVYILRKEYKYIKEIKNFLGKKYRIISSTKSYNPYSVEEWVSSVKNASIVLTNSFHGMVFSLLFHVPFIVCPAVDSDASMNDRFYTILSLFELEHRIISKFNIEELQKVIGQEINWKSVDMKIQELKKETDLFFDKNLI